MIFDGSHGTALNPGIRVRDQVRYPTAADGRALLEEVADEGGPHFSLHYDVAKAHRQVPVLRCEWGRQACQISGTAARAAQEIRKKLAEAERREYETHGRSKGTAPEIDWLSELPQEVLDEEIWLNTVGTFGVGSAGYWWGRAGACVIRLSHYLQGSQHAIWTMLYSDDGWLIGRTERYEIGLILHLFILVLIGTPLAWHKLCGGVESEWVGYALDVGRFQIGISLLRAQWAVRWCGDKVRERRVRLGELREGLGRLQFLAGPLEHLRPFLGPLYAWSCAGARFARPKLPVMLLLILKYIGEELQRGSMAECRSRTKHLGEMFRLDAKAEGENVAIGGWRCKEGRSTRNSEWFAVELNRRNAPWAFARGEAFRTIASLELLGALVSVMTLLPVAEVRTASVGLATLSCGTDNQGNSYLLDKLMTTKVSFGDRAHGARLPAGPAQGVPARSLDPQAAERRGGRPYQRGVRPLRPQAPHPGRAGQAEVPRDGPAVRRGRRLRQGTCGLEGCRAGEEKKGRGFSSRAEGQERPYSQRASALVIFSVRRTLWLGVQRDGHPVA